jgi:abhydrolase domain-containing protein 12
MLPRPAFPGQAMHSIIMICPSIISEIAFLNKFQMTPSNVDKPTDFGLVHVHNLRLDSTNGATLGAWHILPEGLASEAIVSSDDMSLDYLNLLTSGNPVILYLHGNGGSRADGYRLGMYRKLSSAGYHVITFDYRGYGDSTGSPSEEGLVQDSVSVFKWLKRQTGNVPVYIWGHSLGSAVATKTASRLCAEGAKFNGLILESPFNNFVEAASNHPLTLPFRMMPWFSWVFVESIKLNNIIFASDENIKGVTVPIIILHATDDTVVPYNLGRKLYEAALRRPPNASTVEFVTFDGEHGYGHKHIHKSPQLVDVVRKFTSEHNTAGK